LLPNQSGEITNERRQRLNNKAQKTRYSGIGLMLPSRARYFSYVKRWKKNLAQLVLPVRGKRYEQDSPERGSRKKS